MGILLRGQHIPLLATIIQLTRELQENQRYKPHATDYVSILPCCVKFLHILYLFLLNTRLEYSRSNLVLEMRRDIILISECSIAYLFSLEFFSRTFSIFQVWGTRFMTVPEIMSSSFCCPVIA